MHRSDLDVFVCPKCRGAISLAGCKEQQGTELLEGSLRCGKCSALYSVTNGVPRFVPVENYASSFGFQWNLFAKTQVGGAQTKFSLERFNVTTQWPAALTGQRVLEVGCGAGRFTGIVLERGCELYSLDVSRAVDANAGHARTPEERKRWHLLQASLYEIPLPFGMFDKIFCLGVLQHCPDVKSAFLSLVPYLRPGGEIVIDCYLSQPLKHAFNLKYWLRPFFKWWPPPLLYSFWFAVISRAYDFKKWLSGLPVGLSHLARTVPIGRLNYEPEAYFTEAELKEIKTLSVFDMLSPKYDQPQKLESFRRWSEVAGLEVLSLGTGYNGINLRARRPVSESNADPLPLSRAVA